MFCFFICSQSKEIMRKALDKKFTKTFDFENKNALCLSKINYFITKIKTIVFEAKTSLKLIC
jgi:hypothetical protein